MRVLLKWVLHSSTNLEQPYFVNWQQFWYNYLDLNTCPNDIFMFEINLTVPLRRFWYPSIRRDSFSPLRHVEREIMGNIFSHSANVLSQIIILWINDTIWKFLSEKCLNNEICRISSCVIHHRWTLTINAGDREYSLWIQLTKF